MMNRLLVGVALLACVRAASAQTASIKDVAWLQGCWELRDGDRVRFGLFDTVIKIVAKT